ncbi:hypothetical protein S40288_10431, partial [Stachybotrys chartarum IBT 40288]
PTILAERTAPA